MAALLGWFTDISIYLASLLAIAAIVAAFEFRWPAGPQPSMRARIANALLVLLVLMLTSLVHRPVIEWLNANGFNGVLLGGWQRGTILGQVAATLVYALVWDFFQYWFHRAEHAFGPLWRIHSLHHDEENLNSTTALRVSFWSAILQFFVVVIPTLAICGADLLSIVGAYVFFRVYGFFNHANIRFDLGPMTPIISGPQWHRLHHSREVEHHNANYAAFFPMIDIVFGTYRRPQRNEYPSTGLSDHPQSGLGPAQLIRDLLAVPSKPSLSSRAIG